ncbi:MULTISPECIES: YciI family protein [unclassified Streptomyces]|uniref:YciI family protein n=1 Tax=unclassified Streptomyces TaxID=2593676 RepID=UPI0022862668|nr:YciI family protein [Streptomyces sp. Je 1-369]WAL93437.1 YciI family protein [Streptomyces sp. Je 1-369]
MKYLVMVQGSQADYEAMSGKPSADSPAWSEKELQAMFAFMSELNNDLAESGELVDGQGLTEPAQTRFVSRDKDGRPVITDGPYGETKEVLAGYWVLDCESLERVTEIALRISECPAPEGVVDPPVVIRPIQDASGGEC